LDTLELLESVEELFRLDPAVTYLQRGAGVIARLAGAESWTLHPAEQRTDHGRQAAVVQLRHGRSAFGTIVLLRSNGGSITPEALRIARSAARLLVRGFLCAQRLGYAGPRSKRTDGVHTALARSPLTPREREVVLLLVEGASTRKIASKTGLTVATVHTYLKRIYPKMGVHSRVELVARMVGTHGSG
jgi:DNA-binding CsgD family transcriptional regulator